MGEVWVAGGGDGSWAEAVVAATTADVLPKVSLRMFEMEKRTAGGWSCDASRPAAVCASLCVSGSCLMLCTTLGESRSCGAGEETTFSGISDEADGLIGGEPAAELVVLVMEVSR